MHYDDNIYEIIAENIKRERKRLRISQLVLAEKADVSVDTVKSLESGRRAMSLETYLRIVQALESTPAALLHTKGHRDYIERFTCMTVERSHQEMEFALYMLEQIFRGQDSYLEKR